MPKYLLNRAERKEMRMRRECDKLIELDLDFMTRRTDAQKTEIVAEYLPWIDVPPSIDRLRRWRERPYYVERRESLLRNDGLAEAVQGAMGQLILEGDNKPGNMSVLQGLSWGIRQGPENNKRWLDFEKEVMKHAGITERAAVGTSANVFLQALGIGVGQEIAKQKLSLQRTEDGEVIDAEVKELPS